MSEQIENTGGQDQATEGLTFDTIRETVSTNPELQGQLLSNLLQTEVGKSLFDTNLNLRVKEYQTKTQKEIGEATNKAYTNVDDALKDFGYEKPKGVKTTEYLKSIFGELKSKVDNTGDEKQLVNDMKASFDAERQSFQSQIEELKSGYERKILESSVSSLTFDFVETMPKAAADAILQLEVNKLLNDAVKQEDGTYAYKDADGKLMSNTAQGRYMTAQEVLNQKFKGMGVLKGEHKAGGGAKETKTTTNLQNGALTFRGDLAKTKVQFAELFKDAATKQGILSKSKEEREFWIKAKEQYNFDNLPES